MSSKVFSGVLNNAQSNIWLLDNIDLTVYRDVGIPVSFVPNKAGSGFNKCKQWLSIKDLTGFS